MRTDNRLGTFDEIIARYPETIQQLACAARSLIEELDPDSYEAPRKGDNAASYGVGPSKMKEAYCYIMPQKEYLNLGFFYGVSLADEKKLLEGTGKSMRHIKIRKIEDLNDLAVRQLVLNAIHNRQNARQAQ